MKIKVKPKYKHTCSICRIIFYSKFRGQNICSKECRKSIKKVKKYRKCIIPNCDWDLTIEIHHEGGKEYDLCPNHHSLLTTGKQSIEEVLLGVEKNAIGISNTKFKLNWTEYNNNFYKQLKELNVEIFTYFDIITLLKWKYDKVKKYVLRLVKTKKAICISNTNGGKNKKSIFKLL